MALNPILAAVLEQMRAQPTPPMWQMPPPMARATFSAMTAAMAPAGEPVGGIQDLTIPVKDGQIAARLYTPRGAANPVLPCLIYYHGGGFVIGGVDTHDPMCRALANEAGVRVLSVDYRLAPEHPFPVPVEDCYAALEYAAANATRLGLDATKLAAGGDSAGGALAAIVAQQALRMAGPKLAYQLLLFPVTQIGEDTPSLIANAEGYLLERASLQWFYGHYLPKTADRNDPSVSPLRASDLTGLPPAYVMLAGYDPLHDEGLAYADKLRAAGVPVEVADYPDMVHVFVYMMNILPQARPALAKAAAALKAALSPG